jgi:uncharacterized protein YggU (UPF0235/DUF167 family)
VESHLRVFLLYTCVMYIKLRIVTEAKQEKIEKISEDHFRVWVKEKPERNCANKKIIELMKDYFNTGKVRLVSGHHSPSKIVSVEEK